MVWVVIADFPQILYFKSAARVPRFSSAWEWKCYFSNTAFEYTKFYEDEGKLSTACCAPEESVNVQIYEMIPTIYVLYMNKLKFS